jgi:hypothetical protein
MMFWRFLSFRKLTYGPILTLWVPFCTFFQYLHFLIEIFSVKLLCSSLHANMPFLTHLCFSLIMTSNFLTNIKHVSKYFVQENYHILSCLIVGVLRLIQLALCFRYPGHTKDQKVKHSGQKKDRERDRQTETVQNY